MVVTLIGKVLGLYRDRLLAIHYSTQMEANAFFTASRIPRVFFDAIFASAIAACFIPVFSEQLEKKGRDEAFRFAGQFITAMALLTGVLTVAGMIFPQPLVALFADYADPDTTALAVSLTRVMFPTVLFSGVAFSLVGVLQAQDHFTAPALMSTVSNLVIIAYFFTLDSRMGIYGLALAYLLGWFLQGAIQVPPLLRTGYRFRPSLHLRTEGMGKVFALMGPVMVSTWVQPITLAINSRFGSQLYNGAGVSALEYASNLYLVITGVFILSVTNVIFPKLSRLTAGGKEGEFRDTIRQTVHTCLFFVLPMSVGLMVVARPLISLIYGGGQFDAFSIQITATALTWMSLGMAGYALQNVLSRAYFARQEGKGPLVAGAVSIAANIVLCWVLAERFQVAGLAAAGAVSSTVYALLLLVPMERRGEGILGGGMLRDLGKMLLSALAMGVCAAGVLNVALKVLPAGKAGEAVALGLCALVGVAVYFLVGLLLRLDEAKLAAGMVKGRMGGLSVEQMKRVLDGSLVWRGLTALCLWFSGQWTHSGVVQWFLHPAAWGEAAAEHSIFFRLWQTVRGWLCRLYEKLHLERLFAGSVFLRCAFWSGAAAVLAPLLPTMGALAVALVAYASLALSMIRERRRKLCYAPMNKYVLLFALVYAAAIVLSVTPRGSFLPGVLFICFALFALVVENALVKRRQAVAFTGALVVSSAVVSLIGIMQYLLGVSGESSWVDSDMFSSITTRVYSTLQNPNMLGEYLVLILPLGAALLLSARSWSGRLWWLGCLGLSAVCLLLTLSRGAWLGALIAGGIFLVLINPRLLALAPVALVVMYVVLPETVISRFTSIGDLGDSSTSYRMAIWMGSLSMLKDHWVCGVGPGTEAFNLVYPAYGYAAANAQHSHNLLLQLVSDAGIWALILFLAAIFFFTRQICVAISRSKNRSSRYFLAAVLSGAMGFLAQGMTDYSFYNYRVTLVFWAVLGLGAAWARLAMEEVPEQ